MKPIANNLSELNKNRVLHEFAERLNITPIQIIEHNKRSHISDMRQLYWKLRHDRHGLTYTQAGREIGRGHTTVKYGITRINDLLSLNDEKIIEMWNKVRDISGYIFLITKNKLI